MKMITVSVQLIKNVLPTTAVMACADLLVMAIPLRVQSQETILMGAIVHKL